MKIKSSDFGELKEHPVFKELPQKMKDPKVYKSTEQKLRLIMVSDHKHKSPRTFIKCKRCSAKLQERRKALQEYGFKDYHQYLMWRKVMDIIVNKKDFQVV